MIITIFKFFIIIFFIMIVVGLIRGKGRTKARTYETAREDRKTSDSLARIESYEKDPDGSGMTEEDYMYCCYVAGREYKGYNLKNANAFYTTCMLRNIKDEAGRKSILKYDEIFGIDNPDEFDTDEFYRLGEQISRIDTERKRVDAAQKQIEEDN